MGVVVEGVKEGDTCPNIGERERERERDSESEREHNIILRKEGQGERYTMQSKGK